MENEKPILSAELLSLVTAVKTVVKEQFDEAFVAEISTYKNFLKVYNEAFSLYFLAFNDYKLNKHKGTFLFKNIQLHNQIAEALAVNFKQDEPLSFDQSLQKISDQTLSVFSKLYENNESSIFIHILNTEKEQFNNKAYLWRKILSQTSKFGGKENEEQNDKIHSFLYFFYQQTISIALVENKEQLFDFYQQLAKLIIEFWADFKKNTAFIRKLVVLDYNFESLEAADLKWELDDSSEKILIGIENSFTTFSSKITTELESRILNFDFDLFFEEKAKFLNLSEINEQIQKDFQRSEKSNKLWRNTRLAFCEDRCLELEIFSLKYQVDQKSLDFIQQIDTNFNQPFYQNLTEFELQFDQILDLLNNDVSKKFKKDPHETLNKFKLQLKKELVVKSLPLIRNHLNSSSIIKEIDDFETLAKKSFVLSQTRTLMKIPDYTRKVNDDEMESISPNDLISFEIKPTFIQFFPAFKRGIIEHTQKILNEIETAPSITIFSIESANQYFIEQKNTEEVINICTEGIKRSKIKLQESREKNEKYFEEEIEKLKNAIEMLVISVNEITNNKSAFQIKLRIVKAKAITHSKELKALVVSKVLSFLPRLMVSFRKIQRFIVESSQKLLKHFVIETPQGFITTDITEYLTNTQSTISELPYIYQRLFSFEPLETFELYFERKAIMNKMELAYSKWKEEKFAPVVIIGEKGSGKTTFIRKFLKQKKTDGNLFNFDLLSLKKNPEELYKHILVNARVEETISGEKKIIVLDGLERLFEAKINGFDFLFKLFKIISETQENIFWIVSVHSVSWNFFDKSIEASNYFGYHINLKDLEFESLFEIIENRHNLSGYPICFLEKQKKKNILGNKTSDSEEQQKLIKNEYFNDLNKSVHGNILQTFIYWLRSAQLIENKTIQIDPEVNIDLDFVRSISAEKLIILKNILIHNGLDAERLAKISRVSTTHMELQVQQLVDDGIIIFSNDVFFVTPLIYQQIIKHLNDINLLH